MGSDLCQGPTPPIPLLVLAHWNSSQGSFCSFCDRNLSPGVGLGLRVTQEKKPVCLECGLLHAPILTALLELAQTAHRIGRVQGRTPLRVSMEALLELARVSERYSSLMSCMRST